MEDYFNKKKAVKERTNIIYQVNKDKLQERSSEYYRNLSEEGKN